MAPSHLDTMHGQRRWMHLTDLQRRQLKTMEDPPHATCPVHDSLKIHSWDSQNVTHIFSLRRAGIEDDSVPRWSAIVSNKSKRQQSCQWPHHALAQFCSAPRCSLMISTMSSKLATECSHNNSAQSSLVDFHTREDGSKGIWMELHVKLHSFLVDSKAHSKGIWLLAHHMEMENIVSELHVQLRFCMLSVP